MSDTANDDNEIIPQFKCPDWGTVPPYNAYLEVSKNKEVIETIKLNTNKSHVFGRSGEFSQITLDHPSVSRRHAALVYHGANDRFYLIDLQSAMGTFVNGERIKENQPVSVKEGFKFSFGSSSRTYVLKGISGSSNNSSKPAGPSKVSVRHLLVKHRESRNPRSWRQDNITITKEEAIKQLQEYRNQIQTGQNSFESLAKQFSDCSSAKHGGMLDAFTRGQMQKPFEDMSFSLQVGQLSDIVSTDSGVHIIERMA
ncbi:hypothetical protein PPL_03839 [Heterostelium album PN500]|uniref:Peptidyl-prolyl cis-trans isomerase n=1 Tax=Heterostelium pallidum (strain ATCC 26659 / Pp 5 / PN500) TaxID=670386 RepID=D3B6T1_HETP5|nr:hypothetical protein PPL_03839 [Heterostelium album PN500]EFA83051.1 hypothetical protein PPL_03839 [Heterostelium album PN500]|eukprot:XP_020435168.1 hypothetical protein PPL_03839 [Heterostelium album PN500]